MFRKKTCLAWPQGFDKAFTMTYDDGNDCDKRLVELMRKNGVRGTFNINSGCFPEAPRENPAKGWRRMTARECAELYGEDMEVAVHGYCHPIWPDITTVQAVQDILDDKRLLERTFGRIIRGCAYPYGRTNDDVCAMLRLSGIAYSRITGGTGRITALPEDPYRWKVTCKHTDPKLMELAKALVEDPGCSAVHYPLLLSVWGHSYEFVRDDNWSVMEELLAYVGNREDIWYCTNIELFNYIAAYKALQFSVEQTRVHNPSAIPVWVRVKPRGGDCTAICVPAGQTVELP